MVMSGDTIERMRIAVNGVAATAAAPASGRERRRAASRATRRRPIAAGELAIAGRGAAAPQRLQDAAAAQPGEARDPRRRGGHMDFLTWGRSPWGESILTHISWDLLWASLFAGVAFLVAHASYMLLSAHRKRDAAETDAHRSGPHRSAGAHRAALAGRAAVPLGDGGGDVRRCSSRRSCRSSACSSPGSRGTGWPGWCSPRRSSSTSSTPRSGSTSGRSGSGRRTSPS